MRAADAKATTAAPELFVARQPIFQGDRTVVGYELLFRSGSDNVFPAGVDPDKASARVLSSALDVFGLDSLTGSKPAYVTATRRVLLDGQYACWPAARLVIELDGSTPIDPDTLAACSAAKAAGYTIAVDDYSLQPGLEALLPMVDVLGVHFRSGQQATVTRNAIAKRFAGSGKRLLAKRVADEAEFDVARLLGFTQFQGSFFCQPQLLRRQDIPVSKIVYLQFLRELGRAQLDYTRMEQVIKQDVALSVKLLRYLNAASFGWRSQITSIQQALKMLGERPFRRWASLLLVAVTSADRPAELLSTCLVRARFCELLADAVGLAGRDLDLFLIGLLSLMDAVVGRPLPELLADIALPAELAEALVPSERSNRMRDVLGLVIAYERGSWQEVGQLCDALALKEPGVLPIHYQSALVWAAEASSTAR
jgi:EAL and modified HD-GYP domain-containing signal transduction protein